jgi:glycosyltransferase involved in cell wall biosynthesis
MNPILSIIVPVFNRPNEINSLIRRIRSLVLSANAEKRIELIVVDDGSEADIPNPGWDGISILRNDIRRGAPYSRRKGFKHSNGEYIHFHDSDDDFSEEWFSRLLDIISSREFDLLITPRVIKNNFGNQLQMIEPKFVQNFLHDPLKLRNYLSYENCIGPLGGVTFSRATVHRMSFPSLPSCQDWHMYWEALDDVSKLFYSSDLWLIYDRSLTDRISSSSTNKRCGLKSSSILMCQSKRKRILVQYFLLRGHDVKTSSDARMASNCAYYVLRKIVMLLARHPWLDKALFGRHQAIRR